MSAVEAPLRAMLDTNAASAIVRGGNEALRSHLRGTPMHLICMSVVTEGEFLFGLARKPHATTLRAAVEALLTHVDVLPWDRAAAAVYGPLREALEAKGTPVGGLDTLIAVHALSTGCTLVTSDKAFKRVPGLKCVDWTKA